MMNTLGILLSALLVSAGLGWAGYNAGVASVENACAPYVVALEDWATAIGKGTAFEIETSYARVEDAREECSL